MEKHTKLVGYDKVLGILSNEKICYFVISNLRLSLKSIGFSAPFIDDLISNLRNLDDSFFDKHGKELESVETIGFFRNIVPAYFSQYVIPNIPSAGKILDVGCGTGILAHQLSKDAKFQKIVCIDLKSYPEWEMFKHSKIEFHIIPEYQFAEFIRKERPNVVALTWTLHHMAYDKQERYLAHLHDILRAGTKVIILEDSYSAQLEPMEGGNIAKSFSIWNDKEKKDIMFVYCWIANRILSQRDKVPTPSGFRSLEEWRALFQKFGFGIEKELFIGFPEKRDINTPQSLMVIDVLK